MVVCLRIMKYSLLQQVIKKFEEFESGKSRNDLKEFSEWLYLQNKNKSNTHKKQTVISKEAEITSRNIGTLFAFANQYTEVELEQTAFSSMNEFAFVGRILEEGPLTKTELSKKHLLKLTTVVDILKRLQKKALITEKVDENDKRKKIIFVTKKGKNAFFESIPYLQKAANKIPGDLTPEELIQLNYLLNKLVKYHENKIDL